MLILLPIQIAICDDDFIFIICRNFGIYIEMDVCLISLWTKISRIEALGVFYIANFPNGYFGG